MAHEGVIRLGVPDALLSEIGHSAVLSICADVFLWFEKKEEIAACRDTKRQWSLGNVCSLTTHAHTYIGTPCYHPQTKFGAR